ncbi:MAG: hypothetical protein HC848_05385, partial [Limnobacter sp.]|nr:hypothetical protein [Limnobacter sp.]
TVLSTQALIQKDKAILIGGYRRESELENDYKVPLLGDLPFVGKAFTSKTTRKETLARMFLITPRVVEEPVHDFPSTRAAIDKLKLSFDLGEDEALKPTPTLKLDQGLGR